MAPKLFLTGTTGYIGGSVLSTLAQKHPEYDVTVLLRKTPPNFAGLFPNVKIVTGDYDSTEIISKAAEGADIVVHSGDSDHESSLKAIIAGLLRRDAKSFLIHLSGTGVLSDFRDTNEYLGRLNPKAYSDVDSIEDILSRPAGALHRHTDVLLQNTAAEHGDKLKVAIVCPPDIYGRGRGPVRTLSVYFPTYIHLIRKIGAAFYVGEGTNARGWVHINDLMDLYVSLVEAAVEGGGSATWGREGYFLATSQEVSQKEIADATAKVLHAKDVVPSASARQLSLQDLDATVEPLLTDYFGRPVFGGIGLYLFASNSRSKADRAAAELGYKPKAPTLWETLESDITDALAAQ